MSWMLPELDVASLTPAPVPVTAGSSAPASALEWPHWGSATFPHTSEHLRVVRTCCHLLYSSGRLKLRTEMNTGMANMVTKKIGLHFRIFCKKKINLYY